MADDQPLSRRQREIMDVVYAAAPVTIEEIQRRLREAPSTMAIRRMVSILTDKGQLKRRKVGRQFEYSPSQPSDRAGARAFRHVLETFFQGSVADALAQHLRDDPCRYTDDQLRQMIALIESARRRVK